MDQEKRVIIALALSFGLLIAWRAFFVKEPPPSQSISASGHVEGRQAAAKSGHAEQPSKPSAPVQVPVVQGSEAKNLVVEGDLYRLTLSTQGAVVNSWVLTRYRDATGKPLDLVNAEASGQLGFPMSLRVPDAALTSKLNTAIFAVTPAGNTIHAPAKVEFTYGDGAIVARKIFTFGEGYEIHVEASVFDGKHYLPVEVAWDGGFGDNSLPLKLQDANRNAVYGAPDNLTTVLQGKATEDKSIPGPLALAGLEDKYFAAVLLPEKSDSVFPGGVAFKFLSRPWNPTGWTGKEPPKLLEAALATVAPAEKPLSFRLFVGPKALEVLRAVQPPLDGLVDFGWFSFVAKPLFLALRYIHDHGVQNWGWAIVILTIILNTAMFPLKLKSIRSAQKMQKVAPIIKGIQDRYKQYKFNDPRKQRMNQEVMKVYQEQGINPLGGCLPMLPQIPLLYGFWRLLEQAIELRHALWFGWIKDLSMPDPYYILPAVMIVTMFALQLMTPMPTTDPAQRRMMFVMPLIFGFIFFNLASGLVVYYLTANVVGIVQQLLINRMLPQTKPAPFARSAVELKES